MNETTSSSLHNYLDEPSARNFLLLQKAIAASADYAPYGDGPDVACPLLNEGKFAEAETLLNQLFWNYLANPRMHRFLCFALDQQGNTDKALLEFGIAKRCLEGILSTGTGEREKPYSILHVEDEYDVLEHLGKKVQSQALVKADGRQFDKFECEDGSIVWFDASTPYEYLERTVI